MSLIAALLLFRKKKTQKVERDGKESHHSGIVSDEQTSLRCTSLFGWRPCLRTVGQSGTLAYQFAIKIAVEVSRSRKKKVKKKRKQQKSDTGQTVSKTEIGKRVYFKECMRRMLFYFIFKGGSRDEQKRQIFFFLEVKYC